MAELTGKVWKFGDNIDTDLIVSGVYMRLTPEEMAKHCLEAVDPDFAGSVQAGDFIVGGANFGMGSSREQAPLAMKICGVGAVFAESFARIFYRNALNIGLPAFILEEAREISQDDKLAIDVASGRLANQTTGKAYACEPLPDHLMEMITDGGLMAHLKKKIAAGELKT